MELSVSHDRGDETPNAKAAWFAGLSMEERLACFDEFMEMVISLNPGILEARDAEPVPGRIQVLRLPRS